VRDDEGADIETDAPPVATSRLRTLLSKARAAVVGIPRTPQLLALRMLPRTSPVLSAVAACGLLAGVLLPIAMTLAIGALIGTLPALVDEAAAPADLDRTWAAFALVAGLYIAQQTVLPLLALCTGMLSRRFAEDLQQRAMRCIADAPGMAHLEDPETRDQIEQATGRGGGWPPGPVISVMSALWTARLGALGSTVLIWRYHWWVALPVLLSPLAGLSFWRGFYARSTNAIYGGNQEIRKGAYASNLLLFKHMAAEVRVFQLSGHLLDRSHQIWKRAMVGVFASWSGDRWKTTGIVLGQGVVTAGALVLIAYDGARGEIPLSSVSVLITSVFAVAAIGSVGDSAYEIQRRLASLPALIELEAKVAGQRPSGSDPVPAGAPSREIRFEGVSFTYPGRTSPVFDELDLVLEAGRSTAIVGVNGAGKTTLVKLLARLREPDAGRITVDGVDLGTLDPATWQRRVAAIFQGFVRYELTVYDNIALGHPERQDDKDAVRSAAVRAGILDAIEALPKGWATPLSRQFEFGSDLSGGQWQRLALARALFATSAGGAGVLVLDEPTASLDVRTEADLYDRFLDLTAGLTTLVISHRFSTVRRADHIVVLDEGKVVEQGSHDELVAADGRYASLFALQAERYVDGTPVDLEVAP
jgi:ATP-binding cassette subfamily B protein